MLILGKVRPLRTSSIELPVFFNNKRPSSTVKEAFFCFNKAHVPATCGAAIEVPDAKPNGNPGKAEKI